MFVHRIVWSVGDGLELAAVECVCWGTDGTTAIDPDWGDL